MNCYFYIWIGGDAFAPIEFDASLPARHKGALAYAKRQTKPYGWKSRETKVGPLGDLGTRLEKYVKGMMPSLERARSQYKGHITVQVVYQYVSEDGPRGLHLSADCIRILATLNADLDYDQY